MSVLADETAKRIIEIEKQIRMLHKWLESAPPGRLRISAGRKRARFYHVTDAANPSGKYIRDSQQELIKALAQKDYHIKCLESLNRELVLLKRLNQFYHPGQTEPLPGDGYASYYYGPEELIWKAAGEVRQGLITPVIPDDETFVKHWLEADYEKKGFSKEAPEYYTSGGIRVRSKTEYIIAEMLNRRGIPFHYEKPLLVKKLGTVHPDFTVLNVRRRQVYYWEHMGMMDDMDYRTHALSKIDYYIQDGYLPGKKLILTHETSKTPIRSKILEKVIETYL